jgi:hypothetical protein
MEGLTSSQKGAIAELAFAYQAARMGLAVYFPVAEGGRCDLILGLPDRDLRVQCKWGTYRSGVVVARIGTSRYTPGYGYVRTTYQPDEVDAIGIYCDELEKCYLLPISLVGGQTYLHLRVDPSLNNQKVGLKWAEQYELGAIAQLGERRSGRPKAAGSSPASST